MRGDGDPGTSLKEILTFDHPPQGQVLSPFTLVPPPNGSYPGYRAQTPNPAALLIALEVCVLFYFICDF